MQVPVSFTMFNGRSVIVDAAAVVALRASGSVEKPVTYIYLAGVLDSLSVNGNIDEVNAEIRQEIQFVLDESRQAPQYSVGMSENGVG